MNEGGVASARAPPAYLTAGGRQRFEVELRPGETTIVSWKKLVKEANRDSKNVIKSAKAKSPAPEMLPVAENDLESRVDPGQPPEDDAKDDAPPASRFSAVIEKIERLYMGKNSSDEEDLNDVPDDDEYDTEDSFIDDAELDEYFQVDNSAIKHDGFFVNRGKLERINEPSTSSPQQQQKKQRRKDVAEGPGENEGDARNKHSKVRKKAAGRSLTLPERDFINPSLVMALPSVNGEDMMVQNQSNSSEIIVKKKSANVKKALHHSPLSVSNGEAVAEEKGNKSKAGVLPAKNHGSKLKYGSEPSGTPNQMLNKRSLGSGEDTGQSAQQGEKIRIGEHSGKIVSDGRNSMQPMKVPHVQRKEGSISKSKTAMLEKAIRDLEKMVAESRPPSTETANADILNQTSKRRMPPEMKPKLAKIARLAQSTYGMISRELLNRLMSIVGHMIQLRTLKRNLKNLGEMGLSTKQEINARVKHIKKEIDDMVKVRVPLMKSKAIEQPGGTTDDFQEPDNTADKEVLKQKFSMDDALEDKICDLYDLCIQGMEEDSGPQAHKLYAELVELWPKGCMDNNGIKRAVCRAKDRKKAVHGMYKNRGKKRKKLISDKADTHLVETNSVTLSQYVQDKLVTESGAASVDKSVSGVIAADAATKAHTVVVNGAHMDRPKKEKLKGNSNNSNDMKITELLAKKKSKRKAESELGEALSRSDKLNSEHSVDRKKSVKLSAGSSPKRDLQSVAAAPSSENMQ